jgi:hypothetical protein
MTDHPVKPPRLSSLESTSPRSLTREEQDLVTGHSLDCNRPMKYSNTTAVLRPEVNTALCLPRDDVQSASRESSAGKPGQESEPPLAYDRDNRLGSGQRFRAR